jgi:hypothetical protein
VRTAVSPGAHLSGAVGVQGTELRDEVESRAFGIRLSKAPTADAKAEIVARQVDESRSRVVELEAELDRLERARANGTIDRGGYAARVARTRAELNAVQRRTDRSARVAAGLPNESLRANGVDVAEIGALNRRAANLSGPEVAATARRVGGPPANASAGDAGTRNTAPGRSNVTNASGVAEAPDDAGNRSRGAADDDRGRDGVGVDDGSESGPPADAREGDPDGPPNNSTASR